MKKLTIMRHGKSSWEHSGLKDIDRPLLAKGEKRTKRVCKFMHKNSILPDYIICSPAVRAVQTADIVIHELSLSLHPQISKKIYSGGVDGIVDKIAETEETVGHLMVVGHNPELTDLIQEKTNGLNIDWLPTSGVVTIEFDIKNWEYISGASGLYTHYGVPSELKH